MSIVEILVEASGWIGAALILSAYLLVSMGRLTGQSPALQWVNLVGAAGFVINSGYHGAIPSAVLNVIWMLIGLVTLWRIFKGRGSSTSAT